MAATSIFLGMPAIVASEAMRNLLSKVERVARSNANVLVMGESGSGKELVARALHHYSPRADRPWVDLSCAALPEQLLESELFGYEKGAFSGAASSKAGLFELAHSGTIFLDEIGELDLRMQAKLLRVLDGVPYFRLGGTRKIPVDVRVVAATNLDLERLVDEGRFRGDLYHRLSQVRLWVPPLRERPEDVRALALYFLQMCDSQMAFSEPALQALAELPWPGNVRELRNVVTSAALYALGNEITRADITAHSEGSRGNSIPAAAPIKAVKPEQPPLQGLERVEQQAILTALAQSNGHQQKAAAMLGISRRTLHRKLKRYERGIEVA